LEPVLVALAQLHKKYPDWEGFHYSVISDMFHRKADQDIRQVLQEAIDDGLVRATMSALGSATDYALTDAGWEAVKRDRGNTL